MEKLPAPRCQAGAGPRGEELAGRAWGGQGQKGGALKSLPTSGLTDSDVPKPRNRDRCTEGKREAQQDRDRETKRDQRGERAKVERLRGKRKVRQFLKIFQNHKQNLKRRERV